MKYIVLAICLILAALAYYYCRDLRSSPPESTMAPTVTPRSQQTESQDSPPGSRPENQEAPTTEPGENAESEGAAAEAQPDSVTERRILELLETLDRLSKTKSGAELIDSEEWKRILADLHHCDPALLRLIREFAIRSSTSVRVRAELLYLLAELKDRESLPLILKYLDDPDPLLRQYMAGAVGAFEDASYAPVLLSRVASEEYPAIQGILLESAIRLSASPESLWEVLRSVKETYPRSTVIAALVADPGVHTLDEVLDFLMHEQDGAVVASGLHSIASLRTPAATSLLVRFIDQNKASPGALIAIRELAGLSDPNAVHAIVRLLRAAPDQETQRSMLGALWMGPLPRDLEPLIWELARDGTADSVRAAAIKLLAKAESPSTSQFLSAVALDESEAAEVRYGAVNALASRRDPASRQALRQLALPGATTEIRQRAVAGLAEQVDVGAAVVIRDFALHDADPAIRKTSTFVMGEVGYLLGPEIVQDVLSKAMTDKDPTVQDTATRATGRAADYRPENLRRLLKRRFGPDADIESLEREILEARDAFLNELNH